MGLLRRNGTHLSLCVTGSGQKEFWKSSAGLSLTMFPKSPILLFYGSEKFNENYH